MMMRISLPRSMKIPGSRSRQLPARASPNSAALAPESSTSMIRKPNTVAAIFDQFPCGSACTPVRSTWSISR